MVSIIKTYMYFADTAVRNRLLAGDRLSTDDVADVQLAYEIAEGGGSVWYCETCKIVHSPNRPGACEETKDETPQGHFNSRRDALESSCGACKECKCKKPRADDE